MNTIYDYLPFDCNQATTIRSSLSQLVGLNCVNHDAIVESYWQKIKDAALNAQLAIDFDNIDIRKPIRAGQKLKRIAQTPYPRYRHDTEIMALLYLGAYRQGYVTNLPRRLNEEIYRKTLFELSPFELRDAAAVAYNGGLTTQSSHPIVNLDKGGRPSGRNFLAYAKAILDIYELASSANCSNALQQSQVTNVVFLEQCFAPTIFANHPFTSTASIIKNASI